MPIVPKVTTKGGIRNRATKMPLNNPAPAPTAILTKTAPRMLPPPFRYTATTTPQRVAIMPADKSIPIVKMTSVMPRERMAKRVACWMRLIKFSVLRKWSVIIV
jgi:hypothetical protein